MKEWDRKVSVVKTELLTLIDHYDWKAIDKVEQQILSMHQQLPKIENNLAKNLAFIVSQSTRKGLFTVQEKASLHWANDYSTRIQRFFKNYSEQFNEVFWAKLVSIRASSVTSHGDGEFFTNKRGERRPRRTGHQRQLLEARRELKKKLDSLDFRQQQLEKRYESLALIKENRDAVTANMLNQRELKVLSKKILQAQRQKDGGGKKLGDFSSDVSGLSLLTHKSMARDTNPTSQEPKKPNPPINPIEALDYLNLDKQRDQIDR